MKKVFCASLCREGILGGGLYVSEAGVTYRTGKVTVPDRFRRLEMHKDDIRQVCKGRMLGFPLVTFQMNSDEEFKFIVFRRETFFNTLREMGVV